MSFRGSGTTLKAALTPFPLHKFIIFPRSVAQEADIDSRLLKSVNSRKPGLISTNMLLTFSKQDFISSEPTF